MTIKKKRLPFLIVSAVVAFFLIKGIAQQPKITQNKDEIESLNTQIAKQEQKINDLDDLKTKVDTDEYIEKVAREKLGLVKENEIIFIDVASK